MSGTHGPRKKPPHPSTFHIRFDAEARAGILLRVRVRAEGDRGGAG